METVVVNMDENNIDDRLLSEAALAIKDGGLVAFPTETVYGLGANALDEDAVKKIFEAKGRPQDNPLIVHISDFEELDKVTCEVPAIAKKVMDKFWPGPITIILKKSSIIPYITTANLDTVGIRMPSDNIARRLIKLSGVPIAAPSANISGRPSPTDLERCIEDLLGKVDYIVGGENSVVGVESTILDCSVYPPCILRPGRITLEMLQEIDKKIYIDPAVMHKNTGDFKPKAPGMKYRHYAPKAPLKIIKGDLQKTIAKINEIVQNNIGDKKKIGIMATEETKNYYNDAVILSVGSRKNIETVGENLFEVLRKFDDLGVDLILAEAFDEVGFGTAIMNRLNKSAGFDITEV